MGRTGKDMMAKFLLLKQYRGGPAPAVDWAPKDQWMPDEVDAHVQFMRDFAARWTTRSSWTSGARTHP
jgi:hypothetical protein